MLVFAEIKSQPTEIVVRSHGRDSVYVTWRGVSTKPDEESLMGYMVSTSSPLSSSSCVILY